MRQTRYTVTRLLNGWTWWDGCAYEPDAIVYPTKAAAQAAADEINATVTAWNRAGLADAPHLDNL